jgi:hypothetical protein
MPPTVATRVARMRTRTLDGSGSEVAVVGPEQHMELLAL